MRKTARYIGVNQAAIREWECGITTPRTSSMPKIVAFLGYNPESQGATSLRKRIRIKRRELGLTQRVMAQRLGIGVCTYRAMEKGTRNQSLNTMEIIKEYLQRNTSVEL